MYPKLLVFVLLAGILWSSSEGSTPIRKCTAELPAPHAVQLNDCEGNPCVVKAGSFANMTVQFTPVNKTQTVMAQVIVYINGDAVPFNIPGDNANVCNHLTNNTKCPLNAGESATYTLSLPLSEGYPDVFVVTEVALVDDQGSVITCFVTDIRIMAKHHPDPATSEKKE